MFKRRSLGLCIIILVIVFAHTSFAATFTVSRSGEIVVARMIGDIEQGDLVKFKRVLNRFGYITHLQLNSPGGNLYEAISIGREIRRNKIATIVSSKSECLSACPYIFIGGLFRTIEAGGKIGMHMATLSQSETFRQKVLDILLDESVDLQVRLSILVSIFEQIGAQSLMDQVIYLLDMGVSPKLLDYVTGTPNFKIYYFNEAELRITNVIN